MRLGEFLGDRSGRNWDFWHEESHRLGEIIGAGPWKFLGTFPPKNHPERAWNGEVPGWKNGYKKGP